MNEGILEFRIASCDWEPRLQFCGKLQSANLHASRGHETPPQEPSPPPCGGEGGFDSRQRSRNRVRWNRPRFMAPSRVQICRLQLPMNRFAICEPRKVASCSIRTCLRDHELPPKGSLISNGLQNSSWKGATRQPWAGIRIPFGKGMHFIPKGLGMTARGWTEVRRPTPGVQVHGRGVALSSRI